MASHAPRICHGRKPLDENSWFGDDGRVYWPGSMARHCGYWQINLRCPRCGREARWSENRLGKRHILCDGERFILPHRQTLEQLVQAMDLEKRVKL